MMLYQVCFIYIVFQKPKSMSNLSGWGNDHGEWGGFSTNLWLVGDKQGPVFALYFK